MNSMFQKIRQFRSHPFAVPAALLGLAIIAYALFFWNQGFYWDDQPISWIRYELGTQATKGYFSDSRPVWALLFQATAYLLPHEPAYWQIFALFWRWLDSVLIWLIFARLFPFRKKQAFFLAALILIYPGFNQQWVGYVYSHLFIVLFFFLFSLYLTQHGKTAAAIIFSALHLIMLEYFFLLEAVRIPLLFIKINGEGITLKERGIKTIKAYAPYLLGFVPALLYKTLVYAHPGFGYSLTDEIMRAPLETLSRLVSDSISGLWVALIAAWGQAFELPDSAVHGWRTIAVYAVVMCAAAALGLFPAEEKQDQVPARREAGFFIIFGMALAALGGIPYWISDLPVSLGFPANRALLSLMFGACIALVGALALLPARFQRFTFMLIIAFSAGRQFLWTTDYIRDWQSQKNLFWQMNWRAPALQPGTIVLMNEELQFSADNSLSAPVNWIYTPDGLDDWFNYAVFYPTNREGLSLTPDFPVQFDYIAAKFNGNTSQAVVFYYDPPRCLRLLDPEIDSLNRLIPVDSMLREAAFLSSTAPILSEPVTQMPEIYFPEPAHGWCYYFQKADLARQLKDWDEVAALGDIAFALDDYPNDPVERFVFIEGYAHTGEWKRAVELSKVSYKVAKNYMGELLCVLWNRIERETSATEERHEALNEIKTTFECKQP